LLDAGHVAINGGAPMAGPLAPFGGFNMSGVAKAHST
jgi:acyl-CoA reductase-like NAD-dependent aldehyde dehydrogenase